MLTDLQQESLEKLTKYLEDLNESEDEHDNKNANTLAYWINDYVRYLSFEKQFIPSKNIVYRRGDIIKVNFGYRIGSEHGGLHYAVVIDENPHNSPVLTVVPLTSLDKKSPENIHPTSIYLGNELFEKLSSKCNKMKNEFLTEIKLLLEKDKDLHDKFIGYIESNGKVNEHGQRTGTIPNEFLREISKSSKEIKFVVDKLFLVQKMIREINKMKQGSIAVVNQITTVSKIRICDPRKTADVLSGIRLSSEKLDCINDKLKELFIHE